MTWTGAENCVEDLAASIYHALAVGLGDIEYDRVDYGSKTVAEMKATGKPMSEWPRVKAKRRPTTRDISVKVFQETWDSGALGFGGMGTASMETANTVVITCNHETAVYWSGQLGYVFNNCSGKAPEFFETLKGLRTYSRAEMLKEFPNSVRIP